MSTDTQWGSLIRRGYQVVYAVEIEGIPTAFGAREMWTTAGLVATHPTRAMSYGLALREGAHISVEADRQSGAAAGRVAPGTTPAAPASASSGRGTGFSAGASMVGLTATNGDSPPAGAQAANSMTDRAMTTIHFRIDNPPRGRRSGAAAIEWTLDGARMFPWGRRRPSVGGRTRRTSGRCP